MAIEVQKKKTAPFMGESAAMSAREEGVDWSGYLNEIRHPNDPVLQGLGGDLKAYETVTRDSRVRSAFSQLRHAVTSSDWVVDSASDDAVDVAAADFLREQLHRIRFDDLTRKMLNGLMLGYAVAEFIWEVEGSRVVIKEVKVRKARRFVFGTDHSLRLRERGVPGGRRMPERKFWVFKAPSEDDDEPYGLALAHWLYWPVYLKRNCVKFWAVALEKFGAPTAKGSYPSGATPKQKKALLAAAEAVASEAAVIFPQGMDLELLEATRRAGGDHDIFKKAMNEMITEVILGNTATTDVGAWRGTAEVQKDAVDDGTKAIGDLICESFNDSVAVWLTEWNFPGAKPPRVWRNMEPEEDLNSAIDRDQKIHGMGFEPSEEYITTKYGGDWTRKAPESKSPAAAPADPDQDRAFAEADSDDVDDLVGQIDTVAAPAMDAMIDQIHQIMTRSTSFAESQIRLAELAGDIDLTDLAQIAGDGLALGRVMGEADDQD